MKFVSHLFALGVLLAAVNVFAGPPSAKEEDDKPLEEMHWQAGPLALDLGHEIQCQLPEGYVFLGMPDADKLMRKMGNFFNENLLGIIVPANEGEQWLMTVRYDEDGHVDDSDKIDADDLLKNMKEGTEEANKERLKHDMKPIHVADWTEKPHYDRKLHQLVWGLLVTSDDGPSLNYSTRVLGRKGVVALKLLTDPQKLTTYKHHSDTLLAATAFKQGARYEDFDKSKDKVAEYGLMGLILGGGALATAKVVKLGLLASFWKVILGFILAAKKAVVLFFVAVWAGIKKLFGKGKDKTVAGAAPPQPLAVDPKLSVGPPPTTTPGSDDKPPGSST